MKNKYAVIVTTIDGNFHDPHFPQDVVENEIFIPFYNKNELIEWIKKNINVQKFKVIEYNILNIETNISI
jgi:hypothetical protein